MHGYRVFAEILDYPTELPVGLADRLRQAAADAAGAAEAADAAEASALLNGEVGRLLDAFEGIIASGTLRELEELYTATFDLQPVCCPYLGYQLFGEEYRRGIFMAILKEHYRLADFDSGTELPDHLSVVLRFLADRAPGEFERDLIADGLVPALQKMAAGLAEDNPYSLVLKALLGLLGEKGAAEPQLRHGAREDADE